MLRELGAVPVIADALDRAQVAEAVGRARPEVIVHELTAIGALDMRHFDRDFVLTNRLRTEGTEHLLAAAQAVGARRFVAQGVAAYGMYVRAGGAVKTEEDPLDHAPARAMRETLAAIRHLEQAVLGAAADRRGRARHRRGQITSISSVVNPEKLAHLGPVADLGALLRSAR